VGGNMGKSYEYQVCRVNFQRVTFVNDRWQGDDVPESQRKDADIQRCPALWDYLQDAGRQGWELVTVVNSSFTSPRVPETEGRPAEQVHFQLLFLKRES
jgi:hypothetical protein